MPTQLRQTSTSSSMLWRVSHAFLNTHILKFLVFSSISLHLLRCFSFIYSFKKQTIHEFSFPQTPNKLHQPLDRTHTHTHTPPPHAKQAQTHSDQSEQINGVMQKQTLIPAWRIKHTAPVNNTPIYTHVCVFSCMVRLYFAKGSTEHGPRMSLKS